MAQNTLSLKQFGAIAAIVAAAAVVYATLSVPATRALIHEEAVSREEFRLLREDLIRLEAAICRRLERIEERLSR